MIYCRKSIIHSTKGIGPMTRELASKAAALLCLTIVFILFFSFVTWILNVNFGICACQNMKQRLAYGASILLAVLALKILITDPSKYFIKKIIKRIRHE